MDSYKKSRRKSINCIIYTFYIHGAELIQREI